MVRAASIRAGWGLLAALLLAGCELIDQTTFAPSPEATAAKQEEPKADPRTPLVTIGNMFARRAGRDPDRLPVLFGSHLDSQPSGGKFDGARARIRMRCP